MKPKNTSKLQAELAQSGSLSAFLLNNERSFNNDSGQEYIKELIDRSGISKATLARCSGMSEIYVHQILSGRRSPSRGRLICLCYGLGATLDETQELLKLFRVLLGLAAAYFVFAVSFVEFAGLLTAIDTLKAGNTAFTADALLPAAGNITGSKSLAFSYIVLALRFGAKSLPTLFAAATAYFAIGLLDTMEDGAFTQESAGRRI